MPKRMILIEDEPQVLNALTSPYQRSEKWEVIRFRTADAVILNIEIVRNAFLLVLDILIPEGLGRSNANDYLKYPGLNLLRRMREEFNIDTAVLVVSVVVDEAVHRALRDLGVRRILSKPTSARDFDSAIAMIEKETKQGLKGHAPE